MARGDEQSFDLIVGKDVGCSRKLLPCPGCRLRDVTLRHKLAHVHAKLAHDGQPVGPRIRIEVNQGC